MNTILCAFIFLAGFSPEDSLIKSNCVKFEEMLYLNSALNLQDASGKYLDTLLSCGNRSAESLLSAGKYFYNQNDFKKSEEFYLKVLDESQLTKKQSGEAYYYLSVIEYYSNRYDLCLKYSGLARDNGYNITWTFNNSGMPYERYKPIVLMPVTAG